MRSAFLLPLLLLLPSTVLAEPDSFGFGNGRNGALTVNTTRTIINSAMRLPLGAQRGDTALSVETATAPPVGGLVLVHQSLGFAASTPSGSTGQVSPGNVGRWELARVQSVTAGSPVVLHLTEPLVYTFSGPGAQVVTVPEYTTVTVSASGSLVAPAWDGNSGGILAFLATDTLTNNGLISADGAGFRGGAFTNNPPRMSCVGNDLSLFLGGSYKGEGVVVERFGSASGRGNLVNGGGGGNCYNSGGGGGGHRGFGGTGGRSSNQEGSQDVGGLGGALMEYSLVGAFLFGGGGGAGEGDHSVGSGGGAGGGAVFVRALSVSGTGRFSANGASAASTTGEDGAGGGGAGGSVSVRATGSLQCGQVQANGGGGGRVSNSSTFQFGPGGGGAGGYILLHGASVGCGAVYAGGAAGVTGVSGGPHGTTHGAGVGGGGAVSLYTYSYATPATPTITQPPANAVDVAARPRIEGVADPGMRIIISVDGVELAQVTSSADGSFFTEVDEPLPALSGGAHTVSAISEALGAYSKRGASSFTVAAPVISQPIIVVPENGEVTGPTPYIAGVAPDALTVGLYVDNRDEVIVPADSLGRFRYQIPDDAPLAPGPHRVNAHGHNGEDTGPTSPNTVFEVVPQDEDAGTTVPDAGDSGTVDSGTPGPDAGSGDGGTVVTRETPVLVVPAEGELVDSTPLFAGVAQAGASVSLEVDGALVATVVADSAGAFRHVVPSDSALAMGAHAVSAYAVNGESGTAGPRSPDTGFEVRGPTALNVGCGGCGASPVGAAGAWVLLVGVATLMRRRRSP